LLTDKELLLLNELIELEEIDKARENFWSYCLFYDYGFFIKRPFLKIVADAFQRIFEGKINRIAISMPPRAGKSYITSLYASWCIGKKPDGSVMRNCCTATLYQKFSYDTRDIVKSIKFKRVFPEVKLAQDKTSITGWNVEQAKQVSYFGNGVGGTIIGFGASTVAITDDLFKDMEDALSDTILDKTHSWKESAHDSRLEKNCPSIDIGTRWRVNDVIGKQESINYYDEIIRIPALDEDEKSFCEDVKSTDEYIEIKNRIDEMIWLAEYQQQPIEAKGVLFPKSSLNWFTLDKLRENDISTMMAYCDVADQGNDFLSMPYIAVVGNKNYVIDVVYTQDPAELTEPEIAEKIIKYRLSEATFESNNSGRSYSRRIVDLISNKTRTMIKTLTNSTNKETRILMNSGNIKENFYFRSDYLPNSQYAKFINHLTTYLKMGKNKFDDAPDSLAGLSEILNRGSIKWLK